MLREVESSFYEDKKEINNNINQSICSINILSEEISENINNQKQKNFLGRKRKNSENFNSKKNPKLSISQPITFFINNRNTNNNPICAICYQNISFRTQHYCHCGHNFHCTCINIWINSGKKECPICRQDINCPENQIIELEEENENVNNINNNVNNINNNVNNINNNVNNIDNEANNINNNNRNRQYIELIIKLIFLIAFSFVISGKYKNLILCYLFFVIIDSKIR